MRCGYVRRRQRLRVVSAVLHMIDCRWATVTFDRKGGRYFYRVNFIQRSNHKKRIDDG